VDEPWDASRHQQGTPGLQQQATVRLNFAEREFRTCTRSKVEPGLRTGWWDARRLPGHGWHPSLSATSPPSSNRSGGPVPPQGTALRPFLLCRTHSPGPRSPVTNPHARSFLFFRAKNISPLKNAHDSEFFASRKYLSDTRFARVSRFSEEKSPDSAFFVPGKHRRGVVTMLSTPKMTENFQIQPLIYLTGYQAIPISCGQGSGHPHPVVVDNVSGSFGNLVSPEAFCRL
jgi:hypothetical protein